VTDAVIRQARDAHLAAIAQLRRELTAEQEGGQSDPDFGERFAAWWARESSRRIARVPAATAVSAGDGW
jgi:hypothetical protein